MKNLKFATFIALLFILNTSCRKTNTDTSKEKNNRVKQQFLGKWLWSRIAFDYNHNNVVDDSEAYIYPDTMGKVLLTYFEDGSGEQSWLLRKDTFPGSAFQWEITDNGNRILLKNLFNVKSQYRLIKNVSANAMTLADTGTINGTFGTSWFFYERQ